MSAVTYTVTNFHPDLGEYSVMSEHGEHLRMDPYVGEALPDEHALRDGDTFDRVPLQECFDATLPHNRAFDLDKMTVLRPRHDGKYHDLSDRKTD